jgi:hypothetical protein
MPLKNNYWYHLLLALYVISYSAGLYQWNSVLPAFDHENFPKALGQGILIGIVYFGLQTKHFQNANWLHRILFLVPVSLYLQVYQDVLPFLWFWSLLMLQVILVLTYEWGISWRRIPILKNIQFNSGLRRGNKSTLSSVFYFVLGFEHTGRHRGHRGGYRKNQNLGRAVR